MITSFEVGSVFRIIDEASPGLRKILAQVRDLNVALDKARASLTALGKGSMLPAGMSAAIAETQDLAKAWGNVAKSAADARLAIGSASSSARIAAPLTAGGSAGGGGGRHRPRFLGGGGAHINGPAIGVPGGAHVRFSGNAGGAAMGAAGLLGYGAYQAAQTEDAVFQLIYHSGLEQNDANRAKFRKMLQNSMVESGYGIHEIGEAAKQEIRMFQGTPGGGIEVLPEMLRAATIESRLKGESPQESMRALIGLAHMTKQYSPEAIKKLAPAFAFLSTANPSSLSSIERAAGYAVPLLQSGLEIDPVQTLLMGTALTRAGATNTKSGTWLREMAIRAMPGTSMMSRIAFKKHEEALKALGLVDDKDNPTWFTDGKPDLMKMLRIGHEHVNAIPLTKRAAYERQLFGAQGSGAFSLLADDAVYGQIGNLQSTMNSPEFKNRYGGFMQAYNDGVTSQAARTAMQEFNVTMSDLGKSILPSVNHALHDFQGVLEGIRSFLPQSPKGGALIGARAIEGAIAGGAAGLVGGPLGVAGGAAAGAIAGGAMGVAEQYMKQQDKKERPADRYQRRIEKLENERKASNATPPITLNLNIDGSRLAQAISATQMGMFNFPTQSPAFDGASSWVDGDHNHPDN